MPIENACGKRENGLTQVEDRSKSQIETTRRLSKSFQRCENNDIQYSTDNTSRIDEHTNINIHLLNNEVDVHYGRRHRS